ncbi:MAG: TIGR03621 family F420-dependent LLM class oxidoreductase [Streptosporangiaceae bacterium]
MTALRGFRFATTSFEMTRAGLLAEARRAESLGYDFFFMADHLDEMMAPIAGLTMVAEHIGLRLGTYVLCNDFRNPVIMAKEAATIDVVSEGRSELGLGAGYVPAEYQAAGIPFDRGAVRFERLAETVQIAKLAFAGEPFSFDGAHYQVRDYTPQPLPVQRPGPPVQLGGGGRRMLTFAAAQADIVSIVPAAAPEGGARATHLSLSSLKDKAALVREAAAARPVAPEIDILIWDVVITTDRRAAATAYLGELEERFLWVIDGEVTVDDLLDSPYLLFGTQEQIAEHLQRVREETGASRITVFPHLMDAFQPVLTRLRCS